MTVFLFLKQFVDMLYQYKILDYGMVLFAIALLGYKVIREKIYTNIKNSICIADGIVLGLMIMYTMAFLREPLFYANFFKIMSAFLVYFVGRVYGTELLEHCKLVAIAGYVIIYANFFYRYYLFGCQLFLEEKSGLLNTGAFYYYKTDLAVGVITASVLIYAFGKNKYLKWFTILPVTSYMVFYSGARMGMITLIIEYILILIYEITKRKNIVGKKTDSIRKFIKVGSGVLFIALIVFFVVIQVFVKDNTTFQPYVRDEYGNPSLLERLFHSRHVIWWEVTQYFSQQNIWTRCVGIDLGTEYLHNSEACTMHSMYFKILYSCGYIGVMLFVSFVVSLFYRFTSCKNKDMIYCTLAFFVIFAITGITAESLDSTQMTWFMMIFAGAVFSTRDYKTGVKMDE